MKKFYIRPEVEVIDTWGDVTIMLGSKWNWAQSNEATFEDEDEDDEDGNGFGNIFKGWDD